MIPSQIVPVPLRGIREAADPKTLQPGDLLVAHNVQADKENRLGKRFGTRGLARTIMSGGSIASGSRLSAPRSNLGIVASDKRYAYSEQISKWRDLDRVPNVYVEKDPLLDSTRGVGVVDTVVYGNLLVTLYLCGLTITNASTDGGQLYVRVEDLNDGSVVLRSTLISTVVGSPRLLLRGSTAVIVFMPLAKPKVIELDLTTMTLSAAATLTSALPKLTPWFTVLDAIMVGTELYLAYERATGQLFIARYDASYTQLSSASIGGSDIHCICLDASVDDGLLYVAWSQDSTNEALLASLNLTTLVTSVGPTQISSLRTNYVFVARESASKLIYGFSDDTLTASPEHFSTIVVDAAHAFDLLSLRTTYGLWAPSKPWKTGGRWYCTAVVWAHDNGGIAGGALTSPVSTIVVEIEIDDIAHATPHRHVATLQKETGWFPINSSSNTGGQPGCYLMKSTVDADGNIIIAAAQRDREPADDWFLPLAWSRFTLSLSGGDMWRADSVGASAFVCAGAPYTDDGESVVPAGFIHQPIILATTKFGAGTGSMGAGDYNYAAVYEWRDKNGVLHRSAPSFIKLVTGVVATGSVQLDIHTASICSKALQTIVTTNDEVSNPVLVRVYRSLVGGTGPLYSLTLNPVANVLINNPSASYLSILDTSADSDINPSTAVEPLNALAQLYTQSGELEDTAPPAFITSRVHRGRIAGIACDRRTIWLSKDFREDLEIMPGFNEALTLTFDEDKRALGALDEKWVVLGEETIDVVHGDGPDDKAQQNTWQIQRVQTDVGCVSPHTVACAAGLLFVSRRGIELLDRSLNVTWIGRDVVDTFATYPNVTSAVLVADVQEVRWTCTNDGATAGVVLVWNYDKNVWYTRSYTDAANTAAANMVIVDARLIDGVYTMLTSGGQVYREATDTYLDNASTWVEYDIEYADLSFDGPVGWQHIRRIQPLADLKSNCDLRIRFAFNRSATYAQDVQLTAEQGVTNGGCPTIRIGSQNGANPACKAIRVRVTDVTPTEPARFAVGSGQGILLSGIGIELLPKPGLPRHGANNSKV